MSMTDSKAQAALAALQQGPQPVCVCGTATYTCVEAGVSHRNLPDYAYALVACEACRLVRTLPVPSESAYTAGDEATHHRIRNEADYRTFARSILGDIQRHQAGGRFLDVGCNIGILVDEAQSLGYEAWGIDLDPAAIAHGTAQGRRLHHGPLDSLPVDQPFDVVVANHVLEHVPDLAAFLRALDDRLKPGGFLFLNVPNYGGLLPRLMKANWGALWPHQHVWQFTPPTLKAVVERETSLRCVKADTSHNLEPRSTRDLKGAVKQLMTTVSVVLHQADELRAVFQKPLNRD